MAKCSYVFSAGVAAAALLAAPVPGTTIVPLALASSAHAQGQHVPRSARKHNHINAHALLGEKLHHDGKHSVGNVANRTVVAEVKNNKVVNMMAGDLHVAKVKSKRKMAGLEMGFINVAFRDGDRLAQYDAGTDYYGYCVDDGTETTCYWYDASEVDTSGTWEDYDTYDASYDTSY